VLKCLFKCWIVADEEKCKKSSAWFAQLLLIYFLTSFSTSLMSLKIKERKISLIFQSQYHYGKFLRDIEWMNEFKQSQPVKKTLTFNCKIVFIVSVGAKRTVK